MWFHETLKVLKSSSTIGKYTGHVIMYADIPFDTELRLVFSSTRLVGQSEHFSENIKVAMIISQKIMLKLIILFLKDIQKLFLNRLTNHFFSRQAVTSTHIISIWYIFKWCLFCTFLKRNNQCCRNISDISGASHWECGKSKFIFYLTCCAWNSCLLFTGSRFFLE